jgi:DNA-binding NtrC family response regulator
LKDLSLDVRIIAASNRNLKTESKFGNFRPDLYHRLSAVQIDIPPLRERGDDLFLLAEYYIKTIGNRLRKNIQGLTPEVAEIFRTYQWPGNVRELRNCIEHTMILEESNLITTRYLPHHLMLKEIQNRSAEKNLIKQGTDRIFQLPEGGLNLEEVELGLVRQAFDYSRGNQTRAAKLLNISRDQLRYRLKKIEAAAHSSGQ